MRGLFGRTGVGDEAARLAKLQERLSGDLANALAPRFGNAYDRTESRILTAFIVRCYFDTYASSRNKEAVLENFDKAMFPRLWEAYAREHPIPSGKEKATARREEFRGDITYRYGEYAPLLDQDMQRLRYASDDPTKIDRLAAGAALNIFGPPEERDVGQGLLQRRIAGYLKICISELGTS